MLEFEEKDYVCHFMRTVAKVKVTRRVLEVYRDKLWTVVEASTARKYGLSAWTLIVPGQGFKRVEAADRALLLSESEGFLGLASEWIKEFHLNFEEGPRTIFEWEAIETLDDWSDDPSKLDALRWYMDPYASRDPLPLKNWEVVFRLYGGWRAISESWKHFQTRAIKKYSEWLTREYRPRIEKAMIELGHTPIQRKRGRSGPQDLHFQWLALYQCNGMSFEAIIKEYSPPRGKQLDESTIRKAVQNTAKLVGLRLRKPPRAPKQ